MRILRFCALGLTLSLLVLPLRANADAVSTLQITSISPMFSYNNTDFDFVMRVIGGGFVNRSTVAITYPTEGIIAPVVEATSFISSDELRAEVQVQPTTPEGLYDITVTTPDGKSSVTAKGIFELKKKSSAAYFYPIINSVNPPSVPTGQKRNLTIMGEQFEGTNPLVRLIRQSGPEWYDLDATRLNHTEIHATTPDNLVVGTYDILVRGTGGYGGNQAIKQGALTVEKAPELPTSPPASPSAPPAQPPTDSQGLPSGEAASTNQPSVVVPQPKAAPAYFPDPSKFDYRASFIDQSGTVAVGNDGILTHMVSGSRGSDIVMWIKFKNTSGKQWWYQEPADPDDIHAIRLGLTKDATSQFIHSDWISINRLAKISQNVAPGAATTFQFRIHIPGNVAPGAYKLSVGLVAEWVKWIYDDVHWEVQVN